MKRKRAAYTGVGLGALLVVTAALLLALYYEPAFYRAARQPAGPERKKHSLEFVNAALQLAADSCDKAVWYGHFTAQQVNSYLCENFVTDGTMERLLPAHIGEPRLEMGDRRIRLGFRYGRPPFSTVVSIDMHVWLAPKECNVVALEIEGVHAGLLPISVQSMFEHVAETIRQHHRSLEFSWYRHQGRRVALVRFQADKVVPTINLEQVEIRNGEVLIRGSAR